VVLAGGAFGSPQLLQLSGVGNAAELESLGIDVVADLPGVGEHLQDHLEVHVRHGSRPQVPVSGRRRPRIGAGWRSARKGLVATSQLDAGGFMRGNDDVAYPNLMLHFQPLVLGYDGSAPTGGHGYQVHVGPVCSDARGTVKIRSRDPAAHPDLGFGYLSSRRDRSDWVEAVRVARRILSRPALAPYDCEELSPGPAVRTDEEILDWVRNDAETALHPSSTARMGTDEMSVLDPGSLRVHGVEGLRVVDASAMPYVTNGGTCAPVMMLAEKAADLILGNTPLPPCAVGYYRHGEDMPLHPRRHEPQRHEPQHHEPQHHGPQAHEPATTGRNP
jgi:choline dehydrogenase